MSKSSEGVTDEADDEEEDDEELAALMLLVVVVVDDKVELTLAAWTACWAADSQERGSSPAAAA